MIEVKNLVKDYGGHMAVDQLSFTIDDGQIYGFLGPNGAGKSTTMNIMTGYIGATQGDVLINGHNILEEPEEAKKCIGYLPEQPPLYVDMTVREQLEFAAELKRIPKKERAEAIAQVVELAKLESVYGRLIRNLSKGYRQRVGLAQAVLGMPPVIILDEPTVGLDPKQIIEIRDTIRQLGRKHTVILSSHILSEVSAVCDHIMIIDRGRLIASDTPENLEQQMAGAATMELLVRSDENQIKNILSLVSGLEDVKIEDSDEPGVKKITFRLESEDGQADSQAGGTADGTGNGQDFTAAAETADVRETLFFAFADQRIPLLSMRTIKVTLEEVFLRLTAADVLGTTGGNADEAGRIEAAEDADKAGKTEAAENTDEAGKTEEAENTDEAGKPEAAENTYESGKTEEAEKGEL